MSVTTQNRNTVRRMNPRQVNQALAESGGRLIDVRTAGEFASVHAVGAVSIPLSEIAASDLTPGETTYVICKSGARANSACQTLLTGGAADLVLVEGGTDAWVAQSLPVVRGQRKVVSVERQTRLTIGVMVLAGIALAATVSPWWILLSAMPGMGLILAGVTDVCPLANAIAAMPWNRGPSAGSCCTPSN